MYYREVILEDDKALADSGTETFDINILDPITELLLKYRVKNAGAVSYNVPPEKTITKIELVDGGQTYLSMTGYEAVAAAAYDKGFWPPSDYHEYDSWYQRISIPLQFGRYIGDPEFGFDPTRLRNPQLKFTWAKDTLHATGEVKLGIIAKVMEGIAAPSKILLYKGIESWTGAASGVHKVDLFSDYSYRRLLVRSYLADTTFATLFSHFKLTCDADKLIVFDCDVEEFQDMLRAVSGRFMVHKYDNLPAAGGTRVANIAGRTIAVAACETFEHFAQCWVSGADQYTIRLYSTAAVAGVAGHAQVIISGDFPHNTYCYQFGQPNDPATWFNAPGFKDIDLNLTEGGLAANSVLVQQPRSLP